MGEAAVSNDFCNTIPLLYESIKFSTSYLKLYLHG